MIFSLTKWPDNKAKAIFLFGKCAHMTLREELRCNILHKDIVYYEEKLFPILKKSLSFKDGYEHSSCAVTLTDPSSDQIAKINKLIFSLGIEKFGFIRNPIERLYSAWCHRVIDRNSIPEKTINNKTFFQILGLKKNHNFLEFVERLESLEEGTLEYKLLFSNIHFEKYSEVHSRVFIDKFLPIEFLEEMGIGVNMKKHNLNKNKPVSNISNSVDKNDIKAVKIAKEIYEKDIKIYSKCLFMYKHNKLVWS